MVRIFMISATHRLCLGIK